jgi:hypothetical protein
VKLSAQRVGSLLPSPINSMNLQISSSFLMIANKRPDQLTVSADRNNKFRARSFFFFWAPRLGGSHIAPKGPTTRTRPISHRLCYAATGDA